MSRKTYRALVVGLAVLAAPLAHAEDLLPHERYRLPNGMEVILAPTQADMVAVNLWYHAGSGQDPSSREGLAHVVEHLMFNGSQHVPFSHQYFVHRYGGAGTNAYTTLDHTAYFQMMPGYNLETVLWLESDRMAFLEPVVDPKELKREVGIVQSELRLRKRMEVLDADLTERLFPPPHPYARPVGGTRASLRDITLEDLKAFRSRWYTPANATLALVGGFDPAEARALVAKYFGELPGAPAAPVAAPQTPKVKAGVHRIEDADAGEDGPAVAIGWLAPGAFDKDEADVAVLAWVLESRLSWRLEDELDVADSVDVIHLPARGVGSLEIHIDGRPDADADALVAEAEAVLADLAEQGPKEREIGRAVLRFDTRTVTGMEGLSGLMNKAEMLQSYNHYLGEPDRLAWDMNRYRSVTPETAKAAMHTWLSPEGRVVVIREAKAVATAEGGAR